MSFKEYIQQDSYFFDKLDGLDCHFNIQILREICDLFEYYINMHQHYHIDMMMVNYHYSEYNKTFKKNYYINTIISKKSVEEFISIIIDSQKEYKGNTSFRKHVLISYLPKYVIYQFKLLVFDMLIYNNKFNDNSYFPNNLYVDNFRDRLVIQGNNIIFTICDKEFICEFYPQKIDPIDIAGMCCKHIIQISNKKSARK